MSRRMYSENQLERKTLETLNVDKVGEETYSLEFNEPMKFNEPIFDKNGNEITGGSGSPNHLYAHCIKIQEVTEYIYSFLVTIFSIDNTEMTETDIYNYIYDGEELGAFPINGPIPNARITRGPEEEEVLILYWDPSEGSLASSHFEVVEDNIKQIF